MARTFLEGFASGLQSQIPNILAARQERDRIEREAKEQHEKSVIEAIAAGMQVEALGGDPRRLIPSSVEIKPDPYVLEDGAQTASLKPRSYQDIIEGLDNAELQALKQGSSAIIQSVKDERDKRLDQQNFEDKANALSAFNPNTGTINLNRLPEGSRSIYENSPDRLKNLKSHANVFGADLLETQKKQIATNAPNVGRLLEKMGRVDGKFYSFDNLSDRLQLAFTSDQGMKHLQDVVDAGEEYKAIFGKSPQTFGVNTDAIRHYEDKIRNMSDQLESGVDARTGLPLTNKRRAEIEADIAFDKRSIETEKEITLYTLSDLKRRIAQYEQSEDKKDFVQRSNFNSARDDKEQFDKLYQPSGLENQYVEIIDGPNKGLQVPLYEEIYFNRKKYGDEEYLELKPIFRPWLQTFRESTPAQISDGKIANPTYVGTERSVLYLPPQIFIPADKDVSFSTGVGDALKGAGPRAEIVRGSGLYDENPEQISDLQKREREKIMRKYRLLEGDQQSQVQQATPPVDTMQQEPTPIPTPTPAPEPQPEPAPEPAPEPVPAEEPAQQQDVSDREKEFQEPAAGETYTPETMISRDEEAEERYEEPILQGLPDKPTDEFSQIYQLSVARDKEAQGKMREAADELSEEEALKLQEAWRNQDVDLFMRILDMGHRRLKGSQ